MRNIDPGYAKKIWISHFSNHDEWYVEDNICRCLQPFDLNFIERILDKFIGKINEARKI